MSALIGYGGAVLLIAVAVIAMVMIGRRRRPRRSSVSPAEPTQTDDVDATGYVPGVWLLGGAESAAPGHHAHGSQHGHDAGGSHSGGSGGGHAGGGGH